MRRPMDQSSTGGFAGRNRTPLKTVRYLGSSHSGTEHFIRQRLTALSNAILVLVLVFVAIALSGASHAEAVALVGSPWVAVPLALAIVSVAVHLQLGMQVIIEDYVHSDGLRMALVIANIFFAIGIAAVALFAIVRIIFATLVAPS